jgi:hypothetical protein
VSTNSQKKKPIGLIVGLVVLLVLVCCGGVGTAGYLLIDRAADEATSGLPDGPPQTSRATGETVRFEVEGAGAIRGLIHSSENGPVTVDARLPWSAEVRCCGEPDYTVFGTLDGGQGGPVTCRILVDGKKVIEKTEPTSADCTWRPDGPN